MPPIVLILTSVLCTAPCTQPHAPAALVAGPLAVGSLMQGTIRDRVWTHDVGHVLTPGIGTLAIYGLAQDMGGSRKTARWTALGTMAAAMVLKEVYDYSQVENFSGRDLLVGVAGTLGGLVIAERIAWEPAERSGPTR